VNKETAPINLQEVAEPTLLNERVIYEQGSYSRVEQYLQGHHPKLGILTHGWSGEETIRQIDRIKPVVTITVYE